MRGNNVDSISLRHARALDTAVAMLIKNRICPSRAQVTYCPGVRLRSNDEIKTCITCWLRSLTSDLQDTQQQEWRESMRAEQRPEPTDYEALEELCIERLRTIERLKGDLRKVYNHLQERFGLARSELVKLFGAELMNWLPDREE